MRAAAPRQNHPKSRFRDTFDRPWHGRAMSTPNELQLDLGEAPAETELDLELQLDLERAFDQMESRECVELPAEELAEWADLGLTVHS